ncbi:Magnesium chelatase ATPase subunit D [Sulfitobacter noctilucicola]|uniref:Magnesium chelatase subunit D n=1 Tax=Sulfitobacter noctilucicola TaxID=1342301 RepID=A0A7W6Q5T5_9RHOB|nr:magnesium chelatase subunit D [Sulfitobacter noctilucicola]KIN70050.1 Magnesium chelatase ATPase subunit D [Sulfitobacter noctilucicola]MBB4176063.1 magnesium chelatase subunit D [Sulfitobacter noctilucicola]
MTPWERATLALTLLRIDPEGLGGIVLHARAGPVRDAFVALLPATSMRLHPSMSQETLTGGIDVAASLTDGTLARQRGLLDRSHSGFVLTMAERASPLLSNVLAGTLDCGSGNWVVALDEHTEGEDPPPAALTDRLAFSVSLQDTSLREISEIQDIKLPSRRITVHASDHIVEDLVTLAVSLGITSLRAPSFALSAAKANAALNRRNFVAPEDIAVAAELVLAPRATRFPEQPQEEAIQDTARSEQPEDDATTDQSGSATIPQDIILQAVLAALPPDILKKAGSNQTKSGTGSGSGNKQIGNRRGRPLPARDAGTRPPDARIDLVSTLRACIPWQMLRRKNQPERLGPIIFPTDLRFKRYEDLSDRVLVFAVDASGSAALARLSEAKGAVELLLAEAYARRDHVALISFRGDSAEVLLPPTRSLVQTKRRLAALPGGGGTPLANGLKCGLETAMTVKRKGLSPVIVLLTDGRANVALDGTPDRHKAGLDAKTIAAQIAAQNIDSIVIDTGKRPDRSLNDLALSLRGRYVSLPRADAQSLSATVNRALDS